MQGCRKGRFMLDIKRVLKAAPTKMRSREPLQQLWTPWGERIDHEWLSARAGNKAFNPAEEGERTLDEGRTRQLHHAQWLVGLRDRVHSGR